MTNKLIVIVNKNLKAFGAILLMAFFSLSYAQTPMKMSGKTSVEKSPAYASPETEELIQNVLKAHGGMEEWKKVKTLRFRVFTKVLNSNAPPFLSTEMVETTTGSSLLEWTLMDATTVWNGKEVWSKGWKIDGLPPGFFSHLSYAFITLPFRTQDEGVKLEAPEKGKIPGKTDEYITVRMTYAKQNPNIPGNYYRLYIDPKTNLIRALEFNITHPGMVENPGQAIGPNFHVFEDYDKVGEIVLPIYYVTKGTDANGNPTDGAIHSIFDISVNRPPDPARLKKPAGAVVDTQTMEFWRGNKSN